MTLIDDPDDDVWTGPVFGLETSQEALNNIPDTLVEGMAEDPVVVDASQVTARSGIRTRI
jgi:hypothetical protein